MDPEKKEMVAYQGAGAYLHREMKHTRATGKTDQGSGESRSKHAPIPKRQVGYFSIERGDPMVALANRARPSFVGLRIKQ